MKIGIITAHSMVNPGAFLQAYALSKIIKSLGYDAEIINLLQWELIKKEIVSTFYRNKGIARLSEQIAIAKYFLFRYRYLPLSPIVIKENSFLFKEYQAFIFGSDEIWNYQNYFFEFTPIFFGLGLCNAKKISYAPSFGSIDGNTILPNSIKNALSSIDVISVRDENSKKIIRRNLPDKDCAICLDPTLLYNFSEEIDRHIKSLFKPFVLIYANSLNEVIKEQILVFAKTQNLEVVIAGMRTPWANKSSTSFNPFYVLSLFKQAQFVFTNTFHGAIFCLKYSKNFAIEVNKGKMNKVDFLVNSFSLGNHVLDENDELLANIQQNKYLKSVNESLIETQRKESLDFIVSSLL